MGLNSKYRRWSEEDNKYMLEHYASTRNKTLSIYLERTPESIRKQAKTLGLQKDGRVSIGKTIKGRKAKTPSIWKLYKEILVKRKKADKKKAEIKKLIEKEKRWNSKPEKKVFERKKYTGKKYSKTITINNKSMTVSCSTPEKLIKLIKNLKKREL